MWKQLLTWSGSVLVVGVPKMFVGVVSDGHVPALMAFSMGCVVLGLGLGIFVPRSFLPWAGPYGYLNRLVKLLDSDDTGSISKEEFDVLNLAIMRNRALYGKTTARRYMGTTEKWKLRTLCTYACAWFVISCYIFYLICWISGQGALTMMGTVVSSSIGLACGGIALLPMAYLLFQIRASNQRLRKFLALEGIEPFTPRIHTPVLTPRAATVTKTE